MVTSTSDQAGSLFYYRAGNLTIHPPEIKKISK